MSGPVLRRPALLLFVVACGSGAKPAASPAEPSIPRPASEAASLPALAPGAAALSDEELLARDRADAALKFAGKIYRDASQAPLVTSCAPSGAEQCGDGIDNDCDGRYDDLGCGYGTGVLQWTVTWSGAADLNLSVVGPTGQAVTSQRPRDEAAKLVLDHACAGNCPAANVENVLVPANEVPVSGTYLATLELAKLGAEPAHEPIHARLSGRIGRMTWHTEVQLAPFVGAEYRVTYPVGADSDGDNVVDEHDACPGEQGCWFDDLSYRGCADRDADSVPDKIDACPEKTGLSSDDPKRHGCPLEFGAAWVTNDGIKITKRIEFATGTAELRPESHATIRDVARAIKSRPGIVSRLAIDGHTDDVGEDAANVELSFERAAAVAVELSRLGVPGDLLEARGYGETKPLATNESEAGRQTNRRVEFVALRPPPRTAECW